MVSGEAEAGRAAEQPADRQSDDVRWIVAGVLFGLYSSHMPMHGKGKLLYA
jgi:hypothetical protein